MSLPLRRLLEFVCLLLIGLGIAFRFLWTDWSQGANLHPDEYGLTNTLTQLRLPNDLDGYFNTRLSPLSPYKRYDAAGEAVGNGPDNGMRWGQWPMILIRAAAEWSGNTGYDELRLMGRRLSALSDCLSLLFIFLIGRRLYGRTVGLLGAALSALAVMQIQQAHFMTVDTFGALFTMLAMYTAVRIAENPLLSRWAAGWYALFGVLLGMTMASKINLLPVGGMLLLAAVIGAANLRLKTRHDLEVVCVLTAAYLALAFSLAMITFRFTQPMSFRAAQGDTFWYTAQPNPDWLSSMRAAQSESSGIGGGPPAEQWAHRPTLVFPLINMILWGMGLPLGAAAWLGVLWAAWRMLRYREDWQLHLLPLAWIGGYTLFMGTRWVMSIRYFLPVYPFLCLMAAWALLRLWTAPTTTRPAPGRKRALLAQALIYGTLLGTLVWSLVFVNAVYRQDHTRIRAARWIYQNIPAPFHFELRGDTGDAFYLPVGAADGVGVSGSAQLMLSFTPAQSGVLKNVTLAHASSQGGPGSLRLVISNDPAGRTVIDEAFLPIPAAGENISASGVRGAFTLGGRLEKDQLYFLLAVSADGTHIILNRSVISNEHWDEGLPMPLNGLNPFGEFYRGVEMQIRWYDNEEKRQMFLDTLAQADYIILPSQRAIWSSCRLPRTFPMTMDYYRALFDGRLGFDLAALFTSPFELGPLQISDVGGTWAWGRTPSLPLFNHNLLAAEEAFSVYDHPPVWIFRKRPDFDLSAVRQILEAVDLGQVVVQSPREADGDWCP